MSFSKDIKRFTDRANKAANAVFRGSALEIIKAIIMRSPVASGRLRGNWQASINRPATGILNVEDKSGNATLRAASSATARVKNGDSIFFMNNLPYSISIENGHSTVKAPRGMVKVTIQEWKAAVAREAAKQ